MTTVAVPTVSAKSIARVHKTGLNATVTFQLDQDMLLAAEDQATSQGLSLADWLQQALNDALRSYLGI